jgi:hypothetical protein
MPVAVIRERVDGKRLIGTLGFLRERTRGTLLHEITCVRPKDLLGLTKGLDAARWGQPTVSLADPPAGAAEPVGSKRIQTQSR